MHTGFDILEYNTSLRRYWRERVLAGAVDFSIVTAISTAIVYLVPDFGWGMTAVLAIFFLTGVMWFIYSTVLEGFTGLTVGKRIWGLRCVAHVGEIGWRRAVLRNLAKLFAPVIIADVLFGLGTEGDPRQRFTERVFDVLVIKERFSTMHLHMEHRWGPRRIA